MVLALADRPLFPISLFFLFRTWKYFLLQDRVRQNIRRLLVSFLLWPGKKERLFLAEKRFSLSRFKRLQNRIDKQKSWDFVRGKKEFNAPTLLALAHEFRMKFKFWNERWKEKLGGGDNWSSQSFFLHQVNEAITHLSPPEIAKSWDFFPLLFQHFSSPLFLLFLNHFVNFRLVNSSYSAKCFISSRLLMQLQ